MSSTQERQATQVSEKDTALNRDMPHIMSKPTSEKEMMDLLKIEFELREKRLKLVYRVLYVTVVLWASSIIFIETKEMSNEMIPFFTFILALTSVLIIRIVKYVLVELRCMRLRKDIEINIENDAETQYDYIWSFFGLSLCILLILLMFNFVKPELFNLLVLKWVFGICSFIYTAFTIRELVFLITKKQLSMKCRLWTDIISMLAGNLLAYSGIAIGFVSRFVA